MKQSVALSLALVLSVAIPSASHAQSGDMKGMESGKKTQGATHKGVGVVKRVDSAKGTVTLDHEPIKSMNWSAMTMTFGVKDKKLLDNLQSGKKVEFEFVQEGKDNVITGVK